MGLIMLDRTPQRGAWQANAHLLRHQVATLRRRGSAG